MNTVCIAKTKKGTQCKNKQQLCGNYCYLHKKNNNNIVLPEEIILEILGWCDSVTIKKYSITRKNCKLTNSFFITMFDRDKLPILNKNIINSVKEWNIEYQKVSYYKKEVSLLTKIIEKYSKFVVINTNTDMLYVEYDKTYKVSGIVYDKECFSYFLMKILYEYSDTKIRVKGRYIRRKDIQKNTRKSIIHNKNIMKIYNDNKF
jgi:hypothetical protein